MAKTIKKPTEPTIRDRWTAEAKKLIGCTIVDAGYMSPGDCEAQGWCESAPVFMLKTADGKQLFLSPQSDDEGNGPGALALWGDGAIPVLKSTGGLLPVIRNND